MNAADLLRFEFVTSSLKIDEDCLLYNHNSSSYKIISIENPVPNPIKNITEEDLFTFSTDLSLIYSNTNIEQSSIRKLQSSIRQYRFGQDAYNDKDKFLNWWMGLESLATTGQGSIGKNTIDHISISVAMSYLQRLIEDLLITLKYCRIQLPNTLEGIPQSHSLADLTIFQLIEILQDEKANKELIEKCSEFPTLKFRCEKICEWMNDPAKTKPLLENHLNHLKWQLARLYRIRCCIVHGSDIRFRLGLFIANLEYYLKQTIVFIIESLKENDHIVSLDEIYERTFYSWERMMNALSTNGGDKKKVIRETIFSRIVTQK